MEIVKSVMLIARKRFDVTKCSGKLLEKLEDGKQDKIPAGLEKPVYAIGDTLTVSESNIKAINQGFDLQARAKKGALLMKQYGAKNASVEVNEEGELEVFA